MTALALLGLALVLFAGATAANYANRSTGARRSRCGARRDKAVTL